MMKKGFTLMEILAVLLVLAVIASFAVPVVRSVMDEVRYRKARVGATKVAEAVRTFYRSSKGYMATGSFTGRTAPTSGDCNHPAITGIPARSFSGNMKTSSSWSVDVAQLFYCQYLSAKDFSGLNYTYTLGSRDSYAVEMTNNTGNGKPNLRLGWDGDFYEVSE